MIICSTGPVDVPVKQIISVQPYCATLSQVVFQYWIDSTTEKKLIPQMWMVEYQYGSVFLPQFSLYSSQRLLLAQLESRTGISDYGFERIMRRAACVVKRQTDLRKAHQRSHSWHQKDNHHMNISLRLLIKPRSTFSWPDGETHIPALRVLNHVSDRFPLPLLNLIFRDFEFLLSAS
jgi:hypothetical protein